ncbi:MAG: saccharopine dehydrogenase [Xanthomonadales bacterium]|nr:saccharopine dehydrogenase NADP-binding domain-containing protein [Gammaproteobacteria bacterium]MBT8054536.1 saccharopine dehydrogenase NADP-binding domain-containing protein [Gammaproteobacteria bacterium]NND56271.1 saccharopine dehydrogenase [Xanthomonadales bacterium]NNK52347.1 saccharopine dehydrogenase [Xanthomonadales bacterium]NNL94292.1 saccharopine dehydrogenase [Xanthomonadales bacterium]
MSSNAKVFVYGASGYTGKLVAESLAARNIPFVCAGRNRERLEQSLDIVQDRLGRPYEAEIAVANNTVEELLPLLRDIDVVINVAGPFMQIAWPVVEAALQADCHYLDTTGEQDWVLAIKDQYGQAFADKGLLLNPANSYMWAAGAIAAEVVLETEGVDSLDILYQIDNGLPSEASTKSFLRMVCNDQFYLEQNELKPWPHDMIAQVSTPHRNRMLRALPWGGACEPVWYMDDPRVINCSVLTAIGEHIVDGVAQVIDAFNAQARDLPQEQKEAWTNAAGDQMDSGEPPKDDLDVQRSIIVCNGQGRNVTTRFVMNMSAPYTWTGEVCAEAAERLLDGKLQQAGFQSAAKAFGHRELLKAFHSGDFCNLPA